MRTLAAATPPAPPGRLVLRESEARDGAMIGVITLDRRDAERPGHVRPDAGEAELGCLLLPKARACGYAAEACTAALSG